MPGEQTGVDRCLITCHQRLILTDHGAHDCPSGRSEVHRPTTAVREVCEGVPFIRGSHADHVGEIHQAGVVGISQGGQRVEVELFIAYENQD